MTSIEVAASRRYQVSIEDGSLSRLGELLQQVTPCARALVVIDQQIRTDRADHGERAVESLRAARIDPVVHEVVARESRKSLETVHEIYQTMLGARLERHDPVVAVGGGITGDVAGFVAASYLRGVPVVQVPTTLLSMVDASVGGKTGVNIELPDDRGLGKNLVGAFWQPWAVLIDPAVLQTLDPRDFRCGLAECIKHAVIADAELFTVARGESGTGARARAVGAVDRAERVDQGTAGRGG